MENKIYKALLAYYREELSEKHKKRMDFFLKENKYYLEFLKGLPQIEKELRGDESLEDYFKGKKQLLRKKIFNGKK